MQDLLALIRQHREVLIDRLVLRLRDTIPTYTRLDLPTVRGTVAGFLDDILPLLEADDDLRVQQRLLEVSRQRVAQGVPLSDFLHALFAVSPIVRQLLREAGPAQNPAYAVQFAELEERIVDHIGHAADVYAETLARKLESKNLELNRLNQQLAAQARALGVERDAASKALASANEFNQRVLESLSSGVFVLGTDLKITLFTERMSEILGLAAEKALGRTGREAFADYAGIDHDEIVKTVRASGRFPLTKMTLSRAGQPSKTIYASASRLYDEDGVVAGTVFVVDDVSERERLIDSFSRYVSRDLLNRLLSRPGALALTGERRVCSVLFADIRGFTRLAESMPPEALHALLNDFLQVMIAAIFDHGGFIDKFVGDKVMAIFGAPLAEEAAARAAVAAAREVQRRISALGRERAAAGQTAIAVGIGVNTGEVVVGNVGSSARMDFTAIGDAVNVADRLQSIAQGGEVLVGARTAELVGADGLEDRGTQAVKGRAGGVRVFAVK